MQDQPLLVSRPKVSKKEKEIYEKKFGKPMEEREIHLIPELCSLTGRCCLVCAPTLENKPSLSFETVL